MRAGKHRESGSLAAMVRRSRYQAGLTQLAAAREAGMSVATLRDIEQGRVKTPRLSTLRRLVAALRLPDAAADALLRTARPDDCGAADLRISVLGPVTVERGGQPVNPGSDVQRCLVGLLALHPNTPVRTERIVEALWPVDPPLNAHKMLQTHISRLRRRLWLGGGGSQGPRLVSAGHLAYQLIAEPNQLDLLKFRRVIGEARQARRDGRIGAACDLYHDAACLWRAEPLADVPVLRIHPSVAALEREWRVLVMDYADDAGLVGRHRQAVPFLQQLVAADPLHEAAHARLMIALAASGQQAVALRNFERVRRLLVEEFGADPGPELRDAHQQILRQRVNGSPPRGACGGGTLSGRQRLSETRPHPQGTRTVLTVDPLWPRTHDQ